MPQDSALNLVLPNAGYKIPPALSLASDPENLAQMARQGIRQKSDVQTYQENDKMIFNIPAGMVDFRDSYIKFFFIGALTGAAATVSYSYPMPTIFERLRIFLGSRLIEDIDNYAVLAAMMHLSKPAASLNDQSKGSDVVGTRQTETIAGRSFDFRLEVEALEKIWPLHKISVPMRIELTLNSNAQFLECNVNNEGTYTVSQAFFHYHFLDVTDSYDNALTQKIEEGRLVIPFRSFHNYDNTNLTGASYAQEMPFRFLAINRIIHGMRVTADILDQTINDKYVGIWEQNDVDTVSIRINNKTYPSDKMDLSQDPTKLELQRWFADLWNEKFHCNFRNEDMIAAINWGATAGTRTTFISFDVRNNNADSIDGGPNLWGNGINTAQSGSTTILQLQLGAVPPGGQNTVESHCQYEVFVKIKPAGAIEVVY